MHETGTEDITLSLPVSALAKKPPRDQGSHGASGRGKEQPLIGVSRGGAHAGALLGGNGVPKTSSLNVPPTPWQLIKGSGVARGGFSR